MRLVSLLFHDVYAQSPRESGFASPAADRYKLALPEFEQQLDGLADLATPALPILITFDDGGVSFYTAAADRLEQRGWRGYCFVSTDYMGKPGFMNKDQIRELDRRGHIIGTHSASHPARFSRLSFEEMQREWSESRAILEDTLGHEVTVGSVPGGYFSNRVAAAASDAGITFLMTSEPVTWTRRVNRCDVAGRFTIRRGAPTKLAREFAVPAPWTRARAWVGWNAKALVKPILGATYPRIADWILSSGGSK